LRALNQPEKEIKTKQAKNVVMETPAGCAIHLMASNTAMTTMIRQTITFKGSGGFAKTKDYSIH
jgi:hypothetical protein